MQKKYINLLIKKEESATLTKLRNILPLTASICLGVFIVLYIISLVYIQVYKLRLNNLNQEIEVLEKSINEKITLEGLYSSSALLLASVEKLSFSNQKIISDIVPILTEYINPQIVISTISTNSEGQISFSATAESAAALDEFIETLISAEIDSQLFNDIKTQNITRGADGKYILAISLTLKKSKNV